MLKDGHSSLQAQTGEYLGLSEQPDFSAHKYTLCWVTASILLLGAGLRASQRTAGYSTGQHCALCWCTAALSKPRRNLQQLLPTPSTPNHLLSSTLTHFSTSQGVGSQMMANNSLGKWICFALSKQRQSDSTSCPAAAALPDIPREKPALRMV